MRAAKRDILEIFGHAPDDLSSEASSLCTSEICPYTNHTCTKTNHDQSIIYGVCSVSNGVQKQPGSEVIICPNRMYADSYAVLSDAARSTWGDSAVPVVAGGTMEDLQQRGSDLDLPTIAFGKNSGKEVQINANGQLSMDWILQRYRNDGEGLEPLDFIGIEVQSIDITGNYRDNWSAYKSVRDGDPPPYIPDSGHGLNWANVHKRLIPQIIRKGNVYNRLDRCAGFFFILPDIVYKKFEEILGDLEHAEKPSNEVLSVLTYGLATQPEPSLMRELVLKREVHVSLSSVKEAFSHNSSDNAPELLDEALRNLLS